MHKSIILAISLEKNQIFLLSPIVKMNANYAEICRPPREVTWRQISNMFHFFNFLISFLQYGCEISIIQILQRKVKMFSQTQIKKKKKKKKKKNQKTLNYRNCVNQTNFWP